MQCGDRAGYPPSCGQYCWFHLRLNIAFCVRPLTLTDFNTRHALTHAQWPTQFSTACEISSIFCGLSAVYTGCIGEVAYSMHNLVRIGCIGDRGGLAVHVDNVAVDVDNVDALQVFSVRRILDMHALFKQF